ncbi:MAG: choice-of-anchor V domain-containing protein [Candidatus Binatia bacterium]
MLAWAAAAHAFPTGIATTSFPIPAQGCNFCHGGGSAPSVTLECLDCGGGPPAVSPLSVHAFKLTVFEIGGQDHAGLNVSSLLGTLATGGAFATNTQAIPGTGARQEITHTAPKAEVGGAIEFSFLWTAPGSATVATLEAWGNAVNDNGSTAGDAASFVTLNIAVGGDTPTPTNTPPATNTPTPTATPPACPATADLGCATGFAKGLFQIKADVPGKEKLVAKLLKGPALAQDDLGNPLDVGQGGSGTAYLLCVYADANTLAGDLLIDRAGDTCDGKPCWKSIGKAPNDPEGPGKGYRYKDGALAADGILKLLYKGGDVGQSKVIVIGKGAGLPGGIPAALQSATQATVQLRSSDGLCLSVALGEITHQEPSFFRAK